MSVIALDSLDSVLSAPGTLVLCLTAARCPHCRAYAPLFADSSDKYPDYTFATVDTDAVPDVAAHFGVNAIPTTLILRRGKVIARASGALTRHVLHELLVNPEAAASARS